MGKKMRDAANIVRFAFLGCVVTGWEVAKGRTGGEKGEEVGGKFVRHFKCCG